MITAEELVGAITLDDGGSDITKLATVVELFASGKPKLKFDGEEIPSEKEYESLGSYSPSIQDRVLLLGASGTWVILGKIGITIEGGGPIEIEATKISATDYLYSGRQLTVENQIWNKGSMFVDGAFSHRGNSLGFFSRNPIARRICSTLDTSASQNLMISKINEIINDLKSYGLYQ